MTAKIQQEMKVHAEIKHPMIPELDYHITQTGFAKCKLCDWMSEEAMPLSPNNGKVEEN